MLQWDTAKEGKCFVQVKYAPIFSLSPSFCHHLEILSYRFHFSKDTVPSNGWQKFLLYCITCYPCWKIFPLSFWSCRQFYAICCYLWDKPFLRKCMNVGLFQQQTLLPWNSNQPLMARREFNFWWHTVFDNYWDYHALYVTKSICIQKNRTLYSLGMSQMHLQAAKFVTDLPVTELSTSKRLLH